MKVKRRMFWKKIKDDLFESEITKLGECFCFSGLDEIWELDEIWGLEEEGFETKIQFQVSKKYRQGFARVDLRKNGDRVDGVDVSTTITRGDAPKGFIKPRAERAIEEETRFYVCLWYHY